MNGGRALLRAGALVLAGAAAALAQDMDGAPARYGATPERLVPFRGSGEPHARLFTQPPSFRGPRAEAAPPAAPGEVRIGVVAPLTGDDAELGTRMQQGIALAVEEANAGGGFRPGVPFAVVVRDENRSWGAAGDAVVELAFEQRVWAILGGLEDGASHVMTRVILKTETPMVNTAGTDPTLTEHMVPWLVRVRPDDRQACYALARRIFETDRRERVAVFRANDRYARAGIAEFVDAARRLKRPVLIDERFDGTEPRWAAQIERIRAARPDAIVVWGRAAAAGRAVRALRDAGLTQTVYGPERLADPAFAAAAGDAAEGAVFAFPFDTRRDAPAWTGFVTRFRARFGHDPDPFASYAYDGTTFLLRSVRDAGLDRVLIRERLFSAGPVEGVTGPIRFDATRNNVTPALIGHVERGRAVLD